MRLVCALALLLLAAVSASAGTPAAISLGAKATALEASPGELRLQSSLVATRLGWSLRGDVLASRARFGPPLGESALGLALAVPLTGALSVGGFANERFAPGMAGVPQGLAGARLVMTHEGTRVWAGYATPTSPLLAPGDGPSIRTGGEVTIGLLSFTGSIARSSSKWHATIPGPRYYAGDTLVPNLTTDREVTRSGAGNTVRIGTTWSATRWSLESMGGVRWDPALPAARWLRVEGAWWFEPRVALRLGLGRQVADSWRIDSAPRGTSVALEWTGPRWQSRASPAKDPIAASLHVVNVAGDLRRIEVTAPGARRVEAMGDFTMWEAVELHRSCAGHFELELNMASGVYRVQVRRDGGAWMNPSNLPGMDDPDVGNAGTLVIE